jgi:hypothetical protein
LQELGRVVYRSGDYVLVKADSGMPSRSSLLTGK